MLNVAHHLRQVTLKDSNQHATTDQKSVDPLQIQKLKAVMQCTTATLKDVFVDCLFCEQCFAVHTSSCSGVFKQCSPDVTHCVAGLENNTLGNDTILTVFKGCLNPFQKAACSREFSIKTSVASFWSSRTCCDSDFCNAGDLQVPAVDEIPNGFTCEDCFTDQPVDECTVTGELQCSGKQNTCANFSGTVARPGKVGRQYSAKGCTTRDFCKLGVFNMEGSQVFNYSLKCSPA
ncbi:uncharacterized protein [Pleurodeles waltl]|uniref:uncharacterized protein n=1 Tax=Pleurodeles waltl TaxID=8319 RepID=UPI00370974B8